MMIPEDRHQIRILDRCVELGWVRRTADGYEPLAIFPRDNLIFYEALKDLWPLISGSEI